MMGFEARSAVSVDVGANDYSALVRGLPWEFRQTSSLIVSKQGEAGAQTRYDFVSSEPIRTGARGTVYLRAKLTVSEFSGVGIAHDHWRAMRGKAHPDMGLSYAWDYLIFREQAIYHLHAACTFSERSFDTMVANLSAIFPQQVDETAQTIRCNCGGGCRGSVSIQSIDSGGVSR